MMSRQQLEERVEQELAACYADYDQQIAELAAHYDQLAGDEARLVKKRDRLQPLVEAVCDGKTPLNQETARQIIRWKNVLLHLQLVRLARNMAVGAKLPPGQQRLGEIG